MPQQKLNKTHKSSKRPDFECITLLLQGGGALGAYQAGVYEALAEASLEPDWVAGISIGAINSAIIAGNAPKDRVAKLRAFWEGITAPSVFNMMEELVPPAQRGDLSRSIISQINATGVMFGGVDGFFKPRFPSPWLNEKGSVAATSYYDTTPLKATLEKLVDFDRINANELWLSVGSVNIKSGNFVYFDSRTHTIGVDHIMASGALPPGFPPIEIEGEYYWDGGLVSNTPLQWVLDSDIRKDTLAFQLDLWSARGELPMDMSEVATRQKEIIYSSRTRAATTAFRQKQRMRHALASLLEKTPAELKKTPDYKLLSTAADRKVYNIIHLIYRAPGYEGNSKDYEFSRETMEEHWKAGYTATVRTLRHPKALERPDNIEGVSIFDFAEEEGCV